MPRAPSRWLAASLCLVACSPRATRTDATPSASVAAPAAAEPPPPAPAATVSPPPALADAYSGTVEPDLRITMRLALAPGGNAVTGSYFYESRGADLALSGDLDAQGHLALAETAAGKTTGTFRGTLAPSGELEGTWDGAAGRRVFHLDPIARHAGGPALVRKKWHRSHRRPRVAPAPGSSILQCNLDLAYPEVFGLGAAPIEAAINEKLRAAQLHDRDDACDAPSAVNAGYAVHTNRGGVLSVSYTYDNACVQCAHPSFGGQVVNVLVDTGATIPLEALFVTGGRTRLIPLLTPLVAARVKATEGASPDDVVMLRNTYLSGDYVLEDKGLRLIAFFRLPHALQALDGDFGVLLPWSTVAPLLDPASPAARVWAPEGRAVHGSLHLLISAIVLALSRQAISLGSTRRPASSFLHSAIHSVTSFSPSDLITADALSAPGPSPAAFFDSAAQAARMFSLILTQSSSVTVRPHAVSPHAVSPHAVRESAESNNHRSARPFIVTT